MKEFRRFIQNRAVKQISLSALIVIVVTVVCVLAATQGRPRQLFGFVESTPVAEIPVESNITGRAEFDKDSYLIGERARYRIRLLWRDGMISPDLDTFRNSIAFFPLSRVDLIESERELSDGIREHTFDFILQAVDVEALTSYVLPAPVVYYTFPQQDARELQSHRLGSSVVHIGSFYPIDVSEVPLIDVRSEINDPLVLRQGALFVFSLTLILLASLLIIHFGRRRSVSSLSEPERLWRQFHELDQGQGNRNYLIHCEQIFTRLLDYRTGISPMMFWSGRDPEDDVIWKSASVKVRQLFNHAYLRSEPESGDVDKIRALLEELFSGLVEEERLQREQEPSFFVRIRQQPYAIVGSITLLLLATVIAALGAMPQTWLSSDIAEYNKAVRLVGDVSSLHQGYDVMSELADTAVDQAVKSAALYNTGTLATNPRLTSIDPEQHEALLKVMFQDQRIYLDALLHAIDIDDEFTLISILTETVQSLTQGEALLKAAVRISPDPDIQRNLELLVKRRKAYAESIRQLLQQNEESGGGEMQRQSIIDLEMMMQQEMPEEYSEMEQEGKDDKSYFIMEGF